MGLPIKRFIAANNRNDIFLNYLNTGNYEPRKSVSTIANAMDVGDPSNFARILDLYDGSHDAIKHDISGFAYTDEQISSTMKSCLHNHNYLLDPHGACAYQALKDGLSSNEVGVFLETAHPAKFKETVEKIIETEVFVPAKLQAFMDGQKSTVSINSDFESFKTFLKTV